MIQYDQLGVFDMSRKRNKFLIALIILLVAAIIGTLAYIVVKNLNEITNEKVLITSQARMRQALKTVQPLQQK